MRIKVLNKRRFQWDSGWTIMTPFFLNNEPYLLSYKEEDGIAAIDKIMPDATLKNIERFQWGRGWTIMEPFLLNGELHLLCYKEEDGTAAIDKIVYLTEPSEV